jgi:hypothetical protein
MEVGDMPTNERSASPSKRWIDLGQVDGAFMSDQGLLHPQWMIISQAIEARVPEAHRVEAWKDAALQWVCLLRAELGGGYWIQQGKNAILLSSLAPEKVKRLLKLSSSAYKEITYNLAHLAWEGWPGPQVILIFSEPDDFQSYLAAFFREGQVPPLQGVQLHKGYPHVALIWTTEQDAMGTLVHELSHNCLTHLPLPLWLNEGIAVTLQRGILWSRQHTLRSLFTGPPEWRNLVGQHRQHWNEQAIQEFWAGTSFYHDSLVAVSYSLAEALVQRLSTRRALFLAFVHHARCEDAGQLAAIEWLGVRLEETVATLLGPGKWCPSRRVIDEMLKAAPGE